MFKKYIVPVLLVVLTCNTAFAQQEQLRAQINDIAKTAKGIVGVSVLGIENRDTLNYNGNARLVMQSVMKLPIAMAVLHLVDTNLLSLSTIIHVKKHDLPQTYSPLRDKFPDGTDISLGDLLGYMVSESDNNACDIILGQLGGPDQVQGYLIHSIKIKGINIEASEADMRKSWEVQYTDWCKPSSIIKLLDALYSGKALMPPTRDFLYKQMTATTTVPKRIRGLLPAGTEVAHKTGSSGTNDMGITPATNDAGIVTLPNGKHFAIAVFVCNSASDETAREAVIAKISKAVYDYEAAR